MSSWASAFPGRSAIVAPPVSGIHARPIHVRGPALIEATLVLLGDPIGEHSRAVVGSIVLAEAHLVVVGVAPRDDPLAGERGVVPVLHVVLHVDERQNRVVLYAPGHGLVPHAFI